MKLSEFTSACQELLIDPGIALEDDEIQEALRQRDDEKILKLLKENF